MKRDSSGYKIPIKSLNKVSKDKDKVDIYFSLYNTNDSNFDFAEELSYFNPNTNILYIRWVEIGNIYNRYRGIGKEQFQKYCDSNSQSGIILAEPGFVRCPVAEKDINPGEQIPIRPELIPMDVLYRPYIIRSGDKEAFAKQIYFLESLGFRDTGFKSSCDNNIFIYRSKISEKYIMNLIKNEHNLY